MILTFYSALYDQKQIRRRQYIVILMDEQKKIIPQYINAKAGMGSVNAESIAKIVNQLTKGTPKDLHQKQLEKKRSLQVASMLQKIMKFKAQDKNQIKKQWIQKIQHLCQSRPLHKYWGHFDFDMFYVACQLLDNPDKKDLPCAVGGDNSVLCTANYAARLFGVRAAMPTFIAKKLCPELILFKPNFEKYRKFSDIFRDILRKFDKDIQSHGLDEAYVDLTESLEGKTLQQQNQILEQIRKQVFDKTNLTVSCGIGPNKMLAKIASEVNKPNGQFIMQNDNKKIRQFMQSKKIRKIPGIGPVNQYYLKGLGIQTAKDILENTDILSICFSQNSCQFFISAALGLGPIQHQFKERKSVGKSQTFKPNSEKQFLQTKLLQLCQEVSQELQQLGFVAINAVLSYQLENYERKDKTFKFDKYCQQKEALFNASISYLQNNIISPGKKIRLLGVKCTNIIKIEEWKRTSILNYLIKNQQKQSESCKTAKKQVKQTKKQKSKEMQAQGMVAESSRKRTQNEQSLIAQTKEKSNFVCPICNIKVECMNNISAFNRHIDKCLKIVKSA